MQNIFVYGTLKQGQQRAATLADQRFLYEATTVSDYWMFDLGSYPGLKVADVESGDSITGEVYEVDDQCRWRLDEIECVDAGLYELREIRLKRDESQQLIVKPVYAYFYLGSVDGCKRLRCWPGS